MNTTYIDRPLDLDHDSRLDQIDNAARALGKELEIRIVEPPKAGQIQRNHPCG